jgi:hypothetical protein
MFIYKRYNKYLPETVDTRNNVHFIKAILQDVSIKH